MHNGCILYGDVGIGKTITSLAYYFERVCGGTLNEWGSMQTPKDVYVITTAKVRDSMAFELQAAAMGVHSDRDLSTNGVKITVDSWNNLHKYVGVTNAFFIFDEQRVVGYGAWARAFIKIARSNEWILLSATPGDTWMDYIPVFIANGFYKHKTDFLDQHVIWTPRVKYPKVLRYQDVGTLVRRRNSVLVHMPFERHTVRHSVVVECGYDEDLFNKVVKKKWHVFEERPLRDASELFSVMRKVVNSDTSRTQAVSDLLKKHPKLIVFYNFDYELEALRELGLQIQQSSMESSRSQPKSSHHPPECEIWGGHWKGEGQTMSLEPCRGTAAAVTYDLDPDAPSASDSGASSSTEDQNAWDYLLSPNGMSQNQELASLSTSSATSSKASSTSGSLAGNGPGSGSTGQVIPDGVGSRKKPANGSTTVSQGGLGRTTKGPPNDANFADATTPTFAVAEWNGHKHQEIPATERWLYLVQYRAGAEGWNCIETDAICFYSQTYSYRDWWQAHGRIDRINTPFTHLYYYNLMSKSLIDKAIRAALRVKKNFNERDLKL